MHDIPFNARLPWRGLRPLWCSLHRSIGPRLGPLEVLVGLAWCLLQRQQRLLHPQRSSSQGSCISLRGQCLCQLYEKTGAMRAAREHGAPLAKHIRHYLLIKHDAQIHSMISRSDRPGQHKQQDHGMRKLTGAGSGGGGSDSSSERTRLRDLAAALGLPAPGRAAVSCGLIGCTWRFPLGGFPFAPSMLPLPHKHPEQYNASTLNDMNTSPSFCECMLSLAQSASGT